MYERRFRISGMKVLIGIIAVVIIGAILFFGTLVTTSIGHVTVIVDPIGGTVGTVGDGNTAQWFIGRKALWAYTKSVYVAVDAVHMWTDRDPTTGQATYGDFPAVGCLTSDGLAVEVDITVRWRLNPSTVKALYIKYPGLDWKEKAIIPLIRETLRDILKQYTAIATIEKRDEIAIKTFEILEEGLSEEATLNGAVLLDAVDLREIQLPDKFTQAIADKLAAEQKMIAAKFEAQSVIIAAEAEAEATVIRAEGTAEAIRQLAEQCKMTEKEIAQLYMILETLKKIAEEQGKIIFLMIQGEEGSWILPIPQE